MGRCRIQRQRAQAKSAPVLVRARGFARSLFSFPSPNEGSGAPRRRMAWISPDRPVFHGRARNAGSLAHMTRAPASLDAPRGISGFTPSTVRSDRPAVLVPREGSPPPPGEAAYVELPSQVPHPAPPSGHLATMPLGKPECWEYRPYIGTVKNYFHRSEISVPRGPVQRCRTIVTELRLGGSR